MKKLILSVLLMTVALLLMGCGCSHEETTVSGLAEPTCTQEGYTGDMVCTKCGEVVQKGESTPATGHQKVKVKNAVEATCTQEGYSGDSYCRTCNELVEVGAVTPLAEHTPGYPQKSINATCRQTGFSGEVYCSVCDELLDPGHEIPLTDHKWSEDIYQPPTCTEDGYISSIMCEYCYTKTRSRENIPATGHHIPAPVGYIAPTCTAEGFQGEGICSNCQQYVTGDKLDMLPHDYVNHVCTVCEWMEPGLYDENGNMTATWDELEKQELVDHVRYSNELNGVSDTLAGMLAVHPRKSANFNSRSTNMGNTFNLKGLYIPHSQTQFSQEAFANLRNLEYIRFFGEVKTIPYSMFQNCISLKTVLLPDAVEVISFWAFQNCQALERIVLPASLRELQGDSFGGCIALKEVVWPVSLTDGSALDAVDSLERILYRGTEEEWNATVSKDLFADVTVTFGYTGN